MIYFVRTIHKSPRISQVPFATSRLSESQRCKSGGCIPWRGLHVMEHSSIWSGNWTCRALQISQIIMGYKGINWISPLISPFVTVSHIVIPHWTWKWPLSGFMFKSFCWVTLAQVENLQEPAAPAENDTRPAVFGATLAWVSILARLQQCATPTFPRDCWLLFGGGSWILWTLDVFSMFCGY